MKSQINVRSDKRTFPCLLKMKGGTVVHFYKSQCGMVVHGKFIGDHCVNWIMSEFQPFRDDVLLSND